MRVDHVETERAIGLDDFIKIAHRTYDPNDPESVWALRHPFAALSKNPSWIFAAIERQVGQRLNSAWVREQPSYFMLYTCPNFAVRANIWFPEKATSGAVMENAAFSYDYPHDHNFDILTVTCMGDGYETDVYWYDNIGIDAGVGSIVRVTPLGRHQLRPGMVFLYETCHDVHTQLPVSGITMTLNFLPLKAVNYARSQLIFECVDQDHLKIIGIPLSPEGREISAVRMLTSLAANGHDVADGLAQLADSHANPRVAAYARRSSGLLGEPLAVSRSALIEEIDRDNVAFKYYEVAEISRSGRQDVHQQ